MKTLRYVLCDVFTSRPLEGNQLAVFTDARGVSPALMQRLAREMNYSETTFVLPAEQGGHARVRIFTPRVELPFAGHPVLGTALVLGSALEFGEIRLELAQGVVGVRIEREGARAHFGWMSQPLPTKLPFDAEAELLGALGLPRSEGPIGHFSNGPTHLFVRVASRAEVARLTPDFSRLARLTPGSVSVFCRDEQGVKTRVFAPGAGVLEDPATGSAAGALLVHLFEQGALALGEEIRFEQGAELERPSELFGRLEGAGGAITRVEVGGGVRVVARGEFRNVG